MTNSARRLVQAGIAGLLLFAVYLVRVGAEPGGDGPAPDPPASAVASGAIEAFDRRQSDVEVFAAGRVTRILPDDRAGTPHQRFLVRLDQGLTVLVAHNLTVAPRVPLTEGDPVELQGEYQWNDRGGVIHWTHRDPDGRHAPGWIRYRGRLYR